MLKSVSAVLWGIFLALGVGALVVFGIVVPTLTRFFGPGLAATALPQVIVVFAAAFAFYWGGMIAAYKAPSRRGVHGLMVGVSAFAISPLLNLAAGTGDPFANLRSPVALLITGILVVTVLAASYVGARRGEALYAYNQAHVRKQRRRQRPGEGSQTAFRTAEGVRSRSDQEKANDPPASGGGPMNQEADG